MDHDDDERDQAKAREGDYSSARIGAALALVGVLGLVLVIDAMSVHYDASPVIVVAVLGAVAALVGVELRRP